MEANNVQMNQQPNAPIPSTTQLEFGPAMQDFKTMFPEMDQDVIEEVLRANKGAVDATIDQLLSMTTDNINEALRLDLEKSEQETMANNSKSKSVFSCVDGKAGTTTSATSMKPSQRWNPPLLGPLPSTFLRIEPTHEKLYPASEDENIALFLQNEEFLSALRANEEFMSTLAEDGGGGVGGPDLEAFKKRLKNMGKTSRKKFCHLIYLFQKHKRSRSAKGILDRNSCGDSRLLSGEPLLSENFDDSIHK